MKPRKIVAILVSFALLLGFCSISIHATSDIAPTVSIGYDFAILLKDDGTAWAWGINANGQLGTNSVASGEKATCPIAVTMPIDNEQKPVRFQSVSAGYDHVLALATDGSIWAWGGNASGQLGIPLSNTAATVPTRVDADFGGETVLSVIAGKCVSYALLSNNTVYAWGSNEQGLLGLGQNVTSPQATPQRIESLNGIVRVFAGANTAAAMTSGGKLLLWGKNVNRQCGVSDVEAVWIPQTEKGGDYQAADVALGDNHSTILSVYSGTTTLQSFGSNTHGQYGLGKETTATSNSVRLKAATLPDDLSGTPKAIAAGTNHMLMLTDSGAVYAWGSNENDKLGVESDNGAPNQYTPKRVTALAEATVVSIDAAYGLSAAIDELGAVYLWGSANDATLTAATPTQLQDANGGAFNLGAPSIDREYTVFVGANATVPRPTYTVTVPSTIEPDALHQKRTDAPDTERISTTTFSVSATGIANFFGEKRVEVRLSADDGFYLKDASNHMLEYQVYNSTDGTTPLSSGEIFATFRESGSPSDTQTVTGRIEIDQSDIQFSGEYEGRVTFTVALMPEETEGGDGE